MLRLEKYWHTLTVVFFPSPYNILSSEAWNAARIDMPWKGNAALWGWDVCIFLYCGKFLTEPPSHLPQHGRFFQRANNRIWGVYLKFVIIHWRHFFVGPIIFWGKGGQSCRRNPTRSYLWVNGNISTQKIVFIRAHLFQIVAKHMTQKYISCTVEGTPTGLLDCQMDKPYLWYLPSSTRNGWNFASTVSSLYYDFTMVKSLNFTDIILNTGVWETKNYLNQKNCMLKLTFCHFEQRMAKTWLIHLTFTMSTWCSLLLKLFFLCVVEDLATAESMISEP